jgi:AraC family transcriptional regulator
LEPNVVPGYLDISSDVVNSQIEQLMLKLHQEVRTPGFASELMIEGLALQLSAELQRYYRQPSLSSASGGLSAWRLRKIDERLKTLDTPATLPELALLCGLSVRQLSRAFRASRGISLGRYIVRQRIESAKLELVAGESVKRVASRMGFCSSAAFASAFRKATGTTPSEFRHLGLQ